MSDEDRRARERRMLAEDGPGDRAAFAADRCRMEGHAVWTRRATATNLDFHVVDVGPASFMVDFTWGEDEAAITLNGDATFSSMRGAAILRDGKLFVSIPCPRCHVRTEVSVP